MGFITRDRTYRTLDKRTCESEFIDMRLRRALRSLGGGIDGVADVHETEKDVLMQCEKLRVGTIKGSEKSLEFPNRALDRETYENLTNKNYALFEAYQKFKRELDLADRYTYSAAR